jgi:hypothetical protein
MNKSTSVALLSAVLFATPVLAMDHEGPGGHHAKMMEKFDADKDGKISKAEHMAIAEHHFTEADANGDGFITKEEKKAMHEKMKAKRAEWKAKKEAGEAAN